MNRLLPLAAVALLGLAGSTPAQNQLPVPVDAISVAPPPVVRAMTLRDFACGEFRPGNYSVFLVHPCTNCPVKVCFNLPACARRVRVNSNVLVIRWGILPCKAVVVRFLPNGAVSVLD